MSFLETIRQAKAYLEREGRVSLSALTLEFGLEPAELEALVTELVDVQEVATPEGRDAKILAWNGQESSPLPASEAPGAEHAPRAYTPRHLADKILMSRSALEGERKQVTVLFADVKGSMELAEQVDAEDWHRILDRFFQILAEGVHRFEGTVNQYTGDGIMALFGAPIAHEDHAQRACYAALALRDDVRRYANELRVDRGLSFGVRIGMNSGDVVVGSIGDDLRMDYTAQGHTVGLAQRMEALAESGHICLSERTAALVQGYFDLEDLGAARVKGVGGPVGLFELRAVGPFRTRLDRSRARGLSTFVGRNKEVEALDSALEAATQGQARVVGIVADAGVGKSRLCYEFVERCRGQGITVHEAHCPAHGRSVPLLPIRDLLRSYFEVDANEEPQTAREKIAGRLLLLDRELEDQLPLIWEILRIPDPARPLEDPDPTSQQNKLVDVIRRVARMRSEREPVVILIDDLHWIDATSDRLLAKVVDALHGTRTLFVTNFRPEYRADWMGRRDYQQLPLTPLTADAIRSLVAGMLGSDPSVAQLPTLVGQRTGGNPFYAEEVVQSLIESGKLEGGPGAYRLGDQLDRIEIPPTVHAIIAGRIDRLGEAEKRVLQTAAVIGRELDAPLLARLVSVEEAELTPSLHALCEADFLFERALYPTFELAFKHPLTQEVAYGSLLQDRRRPIHAELATVLEETGAVPALIAHHWDQAGEAAAAARWHWIAAEGSGLMNPEAMARHWRRAADLLETLPSTPQTLEDVAVARAQALFAEVRIGVHTHAQQEEFDRVAALAEGSASTAPLARVRVACALARYFAGAFDGPSLDAELDRAVAAAEESGDRATRVLARYAGIVIQSMRDTHTLLEHCTQGIELCGDDRDLAVELTGYSPWIALRTFRALALAFDGRLAEARGCYGELMAARERSHSGGESLVESIFAVINELRGDLRAAHEHADRAVEAYERRPGNRVLGSFAYAMLGICHLNSGDLAAALRSLEHSMDLTASGGRAISALACAILAEARLGQGELDLAAAALEQLFPGARQSGISFALARGYLVSAALLARRRPEATADAEAELDAAERVVDASGMRVLAPRIVEERARLRGLAGDDAAHRSLLEQAIVLYREVGAEPHAERVTRELGR